MSQNLIEQCMWPIFYKVFPFHSSRKKHYKGIFGFNTTPTLSIPVSFTTQGGGAQFVKPPLLGTWVDECFGKCQRQVIRVLRVPKPDVFVEFDRFLWTQVEAKVKGNIGILSIYPATSHAYYSSRLAV